MDQHYVWCKKGISMVKNGGGPVLLYGCFAVAGSGNLACMKDIMNSLKYQAIAKMM